MGCAMDEEDARRTREQRRREDLLAGLRFETRLRRANPPPPARAEEERRLRHDRITEILRKVADGSPDVAYVDAATAELLRRELIRIERAAPSAPALDDDDVTTPPFVVERSNIVLHCRQWLPTVRFYRDDLGLPVLADNDWYVEFRITNESSLSVADASRATVDHVSGRGITLSWLVSDLADVRRRLVDRSLQPSEIRTGMSADAFSVTDPEGHRVEIWSVEASVRA